MEANLYVIPGSTDGSTLSINGQAYLNSTSAFIRKDITSKVGAHLKKCRNGAIVVFDDFDRYRMKPGAMGFLKQALQVPHTLHFKAANGADEMVSTKESVFILVTAYDEKAMEKLAQDLGISVPTSLRGPGIVDFVERLHIAKADEVLDEVQ
jgi:hypothetical protein